MDRWFFTLEIDSAGLSLPGGQGFGKWLARNANADPPPALTYRGGVGLIEAVFYLGSSFLISWTL